MSCDAENSKTIITALPTVEEILLNPFLLRLHSFLLHSQWFHWILLFCAGTGRLGFKIHNIFMSSVFQTFNWAFLVSFNSVVSIICWANYLLLNMRCCMYMSNSYLPSCFHVCSCMVMILNWSSVISTTGWKSFHYIKERPTLRITRRMRKRGWWENTRYHRLGDILPNFVCDFWNRNDWNSYFPPSGFLLGVSHWSRRGWRHPLSDNQRDPTKFCNQSVGPSVYYQGLLTIGVICLLLILLLLSKISPNIWDFHSLFELQATNLAPQDLNGKSDPYLLVRIGQQTLDTKDRYIPKQLNPTFGESVLYPPPTCIYPLHSDWASVWLPACFALSFRVFEFTVSFPLETELLVRVLDHDLVGSDDVIGETRLDLENRFYSRHRATCGLALYYDTWVPHSHTASLNITAPYCQLKSVMTPKICHNCLKSRTCGDEQKRCERTKTTCKNQIWRRVVHIITYNCKKWRKS